MNSIIHHKQAIIFAMLLFCGTLFANRTDSFSVKHSNINLSIKNFSQKKIKGYTSHKLVFKVSTNTVDFDLSGMTIDSILTANQSLAFSRLGDRVKIALDKTYLMNDSINLFIHYQGTPAADPSGWGGFYFTGDYAFNLGVGFQVNPHTYGRAWFPCIDEFDMKTSYSLNIETDTNYMAAANGVLTSVTTLPNSKIWHYQESVPMSTYLVSVSVSKYSVVNSNYQGISSSFPVWLMSVPGDTIKVKQSFVNLPKAIEAFEKAFGPQLYSKVGYNMVPFSGGAMEHAGNITYPAPFANGTLSYETLMAHELSHHWWGNNVTCKTAEDMWLNEGWASYCEYLFNEAVYGKALYKSSILTNHVFVLRFAHVRDQNVFSMTNIPHEYTYGSHVYKKGADVIHSLRGIMGDSSFFEACKTYHQVYKLSNASTDDLMNVFKQYGGDKVEAFFQNFVYEKGFPHVIIQKQIHSQQNAKNYLKFYTYQNPKFTTRLYKNMPMEVFFFKNANQFEKRTIIINNLTDSFEVELPFKPVFVCLDYDEKWSDAITDRVLHTNLTGAFDLPETFSKVIFQKNIDSSFVRVEHHWVGPEQYRTYSPYKSQSRYYTVDGIYHDSVVFDLEISYDGRKSGSSVGYLDQDLINVTEDSLTVMYRAFPGDYWRVWPKLSFARGGLFDKQGKVTVKNVAKGDYVLAIYDKRLGLPQIIDLDSVKYNWHVSPNPAKNKITIQFDCPSCPSMNSFVEIKSIKGESLKRVTRKSGTPEISIDISDLSSGVYIVKYYSKGFSEAKKIIIEK